MSEAPSCETCRFWKPESPPCVDGDGKTWPCLEGECRRHAASISRCAWPSTQSRDWCGEFVPKEAIAAGTTLDVVRHAGAELQAAGDSLIEAAKYLKDDGVGFRASRARQAGTRALHAADALKDGQVPAFPA